MKNSSNILKYPKKQKRILLAQLNSNGDCLYATTVAFQIKTDYPDCHLTWAISSMCRHILDCNPHVDEIWEIPLKSITELPQTWKQFEKEFRQRKAQGEFDDIFITQFMPGCIYNYDGLIRSSTFRGYPNPITVPVNPVLRLSSIEVNNVINFIEAHEIKQKKNVILFECSPKSEQSFLNADLVLEISQKIIRDIEDTCVILSSDICFNESSGDIIDASVLTLRENAELTKYCTLLIGCSSGITWISTSDWAKPLPMIQLLKAQPIWFASVAYDHNCWGLSTEHIIEMTECNADKVVDCIKIVTNHNFQIAKDNFHQTVVPTFNTYGYILRDLLVEGKFIKALRLIKNHIERQGLRKLIKWHIVKTAKFLVALLKN